MSESTQPSNGLFASLRRLRDAGLGTIQNRLELFAVEVSEEKCRLVELLLWTAVVVCLGTIAVVVLTAALVFLVNESARPFVLVGLGVVYLLAALVAGAVLHRKLKNSPPPFSETVSQLEKDREWLNSRKGN